MADRSIVYRLFGQDVTASKTMDAFGGKADKAGNKLDQLGGRAEKTRGRFGKMAAGIATSLAVLKGVDYLKGAVDNASELAEAGSKVSVIFGQAAPAVMKFAKGADAIGLSDRAATAALGSFGALFQTLGFGQKDMAGMSKRLVGLSADMASFNDATPDEALAALRSGINGESEPLRRFGVFLNESRVQAEALALGIAKPTKDVTKVRSALSAVEVATARVTKATKEHGTNSLQTRAAQAALARSEETLARATKGSVGPLTDAQKAQARYSIVLKDSSAAHGDFARTSDGLANSQRANAARWDDIKTKIGNGLLPIVTKLTKFVGDEVIPKFDKMADFIGRNSSVIIPLVGVLGTIVVGVKAWTMAQAALNVIMALNPVGIVVIAVAALAVGLVTAYKKSETFRNVVNGAFRAVASVVGDAVSFMVRGFRGILTVWLTVADGIISGAAKALGWVPGIGDKLKAANAAFDVFKDQILTTLDEVADNAAGIGEKTGNNLKTGFAKVIGANGLTTYVNVLPSGRIFEQTSRVPKREFGGPVVAGQPDIVGERRPELFVPNESGTILPSTSRRTRSVVAGDDATLKRLANYIAEAIARVAAGPIGRAATAGANVSGGYAAMNESRVG